MVLFTYKDYLKYANLEKINLREEVEKYNLDTKQEEKTHQYSDKIFKEILSNKKEFIKFLQKYLGDKKFEELTENDIEKYNKEFITSKFKKKESDIVYKLANQNMYIIVEHQSKVDYTMPERMTEYCIELIRDINRNNNGKRIINPVICPIVLYTGEKKWNIDYSVQNAERYTSKIFNYTEYNLIDINNYVKEELIEEDTGLSKALLFEKLKTKEEFKEVMNKIIKRELTTEEIQYIQMIFMYSNKVKKFMPDGREGYIEKLNKGGKEDMKFEKFLIEWLQEEKDEGRKEGRSEGEKLGISKTIKKMVKEMLKKQMSDNDIIEITKIDKDELEKLKMA